MREKSKQNLKTKLHECADKHVWLGVECASNAHKCTIFMSFLSLAKPTKTLGYKNKFDNSIIGQNWRLRAKVLNFQ
nr:hypothetical protein Iba_chr09aCG8900 [Ipomoea batatas]GMD37405.1 hypothetical protein Iba_chr09eCG8990 [Ipomoea batatas]